MSLKFGTVSDPENDCVYQGSSERTKSGFMVATSRTLGLDEGRSGHRDFDVAGDRDIRSDLCPIDQLDGPLMERQWYVIHTLTGQEEKVRVSLQRMVDTEQGGGPISQVLVPMEKISEVKAGKKKISERRVFPGYVLIQMALNDETWYRVKSTPGVSGFVGSGQRPVPLKEEEVTQILQAAQEKMEKPIPKVIFEKGEGVRITEGPFNNFNGAVEEINPEKGKLKVMVTIFGRSTPVELEYWQVEKV